MQTYVSGMIKQQFFITRQAFQQMWQAWEHGAGEDVSGFLLGASDCIRQVAMLEDDSMLAQRVAAWKDEGLSVLGCVQSLQLDVQQVARWRHALAEVQADASFALCMVLNTDTKGCLKSPAYVPYEGRMQETALVLLDDGQQPLKS